LLLCTTKGIKNKNKKLKEFYMFNLECIGNIPKEILEKQRVDLEPTISSMFKVLYRKLTSNPTDDELYTNTSTVASVMLLGEVLSKLNIDNAVLLLVNGNSIFEDLHNKDNDLNIMIDAIENAEIPKLDFAEITMEKHIEDLYIVYEFSILKNSDDSVKLEIKVNGEVEEQGDSDEQSFVYEVDLLISKLGESGIIF
jgi:hypothetical protein